MSRPNPTQLAELDNLEAIASTAISATMVSTIERLVLQAQLLAAKNDIDGILDLSQGLNVALQRPIMAAWEQGWTAGSAHAIFDMQRSVPKRLRPQPVEHFDLAVDLKALVAALFEFTPQTFRNLAAERAVRSRVLRLAGSFATDILNAVKGDLLAAVTPQPDTGNPISRPELQARLQKRLNVGKVRSAAIARTETTNAYNQGRISTYQSSPLVTYMIFYSIHDHRRSDICTSRDGMVIPVEEKGAIAANSPSLHINCRSVLGALMPRVNPQHKKMVEDASRLYSNRTLVPLPKGWNSIRRFS